MTVAEEQLQELQGIWPGAAVLEEGGITYIHLPKIKLPPSCGSQVVEGLLRPGPGPDGYSTRLFVSAQFPGKGQNWSVHQILSKTWYTFSYNNVPSDLRLYEIVANHLQVLR